MNEKDMFLNILNQEMVLSTGCTEPAAISYLSSVVAKELKDLGDDIKDIKVLASKNIIKNAMSAGLPNSDKVGVNYAAGIGALHGNPKNLLNVNNDIDKETYVKVEQMIQNGLIVVDVADVTNVLYIEVIIKGNSHTARGIIKDSHTNLTLIEVDNVVKFEKVDNKNSDNQVLSPKQIAEFLSLRKIYEFATVILDIENDPIDILKTAVSINSNISKEGLKNNYGLRVGKNIKEEIDKNIRSDDYVSHS